MTTYPFILNPSHSTPVTPLRGGEGADILLIFDIPEAMRRIVLLSLLCCPSALLQAQVKTHYTDFERDTLQLDQVEVTTGSGSRLKVSHVTANTELIGQQQLVRAACCNLGESFTTNPSVDVNYSDAATGARQIKLLGLSGTYVQMLTENVPNLRGAAIPFGLGYIPGPWMQSIQVSKGASSVRNGYESTTGQINIEYLKPQGVDGISGNVYYDAQQKLEANLMAGTHLGKVDPVTGAQPKNSTSLLLHVEDRQREHDGNGDGFMDMPRQRQWNGMWRWAHVGPKWISQLYVKGITEERESGQTEHTHQQASSSQQQLYGVSIDTKRAELQWKNALILDPSHGSSIALMLHGSLHDMDSRFGTSSYDVFQRNGYAQLMYEIDFTPSHNLSVGASLDYDEFCEHFLRPNYWKDVYWYVDPTVRLDPTSRETVPGLYAQYTFKADDLFTLIAGLRFDHSSLYGTFWTPRLHLRYHPTDWLTLRASAGKGYRTPHLYAENFSLLASGRSISDFTSGSPQQEEAWNYGISAAFTLPLGSQDLELNAEYYFTDFRHQLVFDPYYGTGDASLYNFCFYNLTGNSYSHTVQVDATYPFPGGFDLTAGLRFSDAQTDYMSYGTAGVERRWRPLTSRFKGMLSLSWKSPLELWQVDVTGQLIGPQMLYDQTKTPTYGQLSAQLTREFHYFAIYLGGENLTGYKIDHPILGASDPWDASFDATQVWGPTEGAMVYLGIRFKIERY